MTSELRDYDSTTIAKLTWVDPSSGETYEHVLTEGATVSVGRATSNDVFILDRYVSRHHAVITYRDGVFVITDLGSVNGTFVNDTRVEEPFPLFAGDEIRLYVPTIRFESATDDDVSEAQSSGFISSAAIHTGKGRLIITTGAQEGQSIPLILDEVTIGRATTSADWEIALQDPTVSRPHASLRRAGKEWLVYDLNSANGTRVNDNPIKGDEGCTLKDGDIIAFGSTLTLFRAE